MSEPPAVANPSANIVLDAASAGAALDPLSRAGLAAKRFMASAELHAQGFVTTLEHGQQFIHAINVAGAAAPGVVGIPPLPPGADPQIVALHAAINGMNNNINARLVSIDTSLNNINARLANAMVTEGTDIIYPLSNGTGKPLPAVFPHTYAQFMALSPNDALTLLLYYGLPANPEDSRGMRLGKFLGVRN